MRLPRCFFVTLAFASLGLASGAGTAQTKTAKAAAAEKLFEAAVKEMQAGHFDEACPLLGEAQQLDPTPGTVYTLADCEAGRGRLPEAIEQYEHYLQLYQEMKSPLRERHAARAANAEEQKQKLRGLIFFNEAKKHFEANRIAEACAALEQSHAVDPMPGTLYALADCEATRGRLSTALGHFEAYLDQYARMKAPDRERHGERARLAAEQKKKLDVEVPRLKLLWAGTKPEGLVLRRGDDTLDPSMFGTAVPMDPGEYLFVTQIPGGEPVTRKVRLEKGDRKILELSAQKATEIDEKPADPKALPEPPRPPPPAPPQGIDSWKLGGLITLGIGGAAAIAGGVFGGLAMAEQKNIHCDANFACGVEGMKVVDRYWAYGNTSTALFIAGGAGLATGAMLLLLAPNNAADKSAAVRVRGLAGPGTGYLSIEGSF